MLSIIESTKRICLIKTKWPSEWDTTPRPFDLFKSERDNAAEMGAGTIFGENGNLKSYERTDDMENKFIRADDVAQELSVSKPYAWAIPEKIDKKTSGKTE